MICATTKITMNFTIWPYIPNTIICIHGRRLNTSVGIVTNIVTIFVINRSILINETSIGIPIRIIRVRRDSTPAGTAEAEIDVEDTARPHMTRTIDKIRARRSLYFSVGIVDIAVVAVDVT